MEGLQQIEFGRGHCIDTLQSIEVTVRAHSIYLVCVFFSLSETDLTLLLNQVVIKENNVER